MNSLYPEITWRENSASAWTDKGMCPRSLSREDPERCCSMFPALATPMLSPSSSTVTTLDNLKNLCLTISPLSTIHGVKSDRQKIEPQRPRRPRFHYLTSGVIRRDFFRFGISQDSS
jgi:hypothetical protein